MANFNPVYNHRLKEFIVNKNVSYINFDREPELLRFIITILKKYYGNFLKLFGESH